MPKIKDPPKTFTIKKPDGASVTIQKPENTFTIRKKPKTHGQEEKKDTDEN